MPERARGTIHAFLHDTTAGSSEKGNGRMNYPSVTQVLGVYQDFSMIDKDVLEFATERGSVVHKICACRARGLPYLTEIMPAAAGYVLSFDTWFTSSVLEVHLVETRLVDETYGFTGTPDLIVTLKGDPRPSVWDLKTPAAEYPTWWGQAAAYKRLAQENGYPVVRAGIVQLKPDGSPPRVPPYEVGPRDLAAFLAALTAWKYFKKGG